MPFFCVLARAVCRWGAKLFRTGKKAGNPNKKIFICTDNVRALMALFLQLLRAHENKLFLCSMRSASFPQRRKREPSSRLGTSAPGVSPRLSSRSERPAVVGSSKPKAVTRSHSERDCLSASQCDSGRRPLSFTGLAETESEDPAEPPLPLGGTRVRRWGSCSVSPGWTQPMASAVTASPAAAFQLPAPGREMKFGLRRFRGRDGPFERFMR